MDWQPIETAPKDGTVVLVTGGCVKPPAQIVRWVPDAFENDGDWVPVDWDGPNAGFNAGLSNQWANGTDEPAFWMPLPEPPK